MVGRRATITRSYAIAGDLTRSHAVSFACMQARTFEVEPMRLKQAERDLEEANRVMERHDTALSRMREWVARTDEAVRRVQARAVHFQTPSIPNIPSMHAHALGSRNGGTAPRQLSLHPDTDHAYGLALSPP